MYKNMFCNVYSLCQAELMAKTANHKKRSSDVHIKGLISFFFNTSLFVLLSGLLIECDIQITNLCCVNITMHPREIKEADLFVYHIFFYPTSLSETQYFLLSVPMIDRHMSDHRMSFSMPSTAELYRPSILSLGINDSLVWEMYVKVFITHSEIHKECFHLNIFHSHPYNILSMKISQIPKIRHPRITPILIQLFATRKGNILPRLQFKVYV